MDYEYLSSVPLRTLLQEHPLAGNYLENLRLTGLPEDLPLLAGLMLEEPAALKEFELTAVQVSWRPGCRLWNRMENRPLFLPLPFWAGGISRASRKRWN